MFEYVRTHQRLMQFILLLFIVPSFALMGVSSYFGNGNNDALAIVNGEQISQQEFDKALRQQMDQMRERLSEQFDESLFNTPAAKTSVLNNLISQRVLMMEAKTQNLGIPDALLQQTISGISGLTLHDGSFDYTGYKNILANQGITPAVYENNLRQDLAVQQLVSSIQGSAFVPNTVIAQVAEMMGQEREIQSLDFNASDFVNQVNITEAKLKTYYDKNNAQFAIPETVKIEYIVLSGEAVARQMMVSDEDIKLYYDQNSKNFTVDEQRRASHILIKVNKNASDADKAAAKAKAEEILTLVRAQPGKFAQLAKQYSQDEGSATNGGDLDFFGRGMMVKPFEDAAFKLKQNETSGLVQSDFGYHIIYLTAIKPATVKLLAEVKDQIREDIKKQKASKQFSEMAEVFTNTVYEQSDSLRPAADKLKLTIETADNLTRLPDFSSQSAKADPVLANPKFLKAVFSDDVIKNKHNTESIEVAPNTLVSARLIDYKAASIRPFNEVRELITMLMKAEESAALATKAGEEKLASLSKVMETSGTIIGAEKATGFSQARVISRNKPDSVSPAAFNAIMKADIRMLPAFVGVNLPRQGYTVYRINKILQATPDAAQKTDLTRQIQDLFASEDLYDFVEMRKLKGKVKIVKPFSALPINSGD
ncbi:MAG: peptidylprolyl isomerase [Solimicrobium sp.]|jgi:peptidyl-prolyl cis-trans isomerase D|nr:peptidylprolyl isomerase [Solimicrobium sp.]